MKKRWKYGVPLAVLIFGPSLASAGACELSQDNFNALMNSLSVSHREKYFNFALVDKEGRFRYGCHKARIVSYIYNNVRMEKPVRFNRYNLKYYIGEHMEKNFDSPNYMEGIRGEAIRIASHSFDKYVMRDFIYFYQYEPDSLRYARDIYVKY